MDKRPATRAAVLLSSLSANTWELLTTLVPHSKRSVTPVAANKVLATPASSRAPRKRADAESHVLDAFTRPANNGSLTSAPLAHANKRHQASLHPAERTPDAKCRERWKKEEHERNY